MVCMVCMVCIVCMANLFFLHDVFSNTFSRSAPQVIKEVRAITGLGLKEAKELVEKAPVVVKQGLKKDEAEALMKALVDVGGEVELE